MASKLHWMTADDLQSQGAALLRDVEDGHPTVITSRGEPKAVVVPFDERLLEIGLSKTLSLHLFAAGEVTLEQAARVAGLSLDEMLDLLGEANVAAVSYPPSELDDELAIP